MVGLEVSFYWYEIGNGDFLHAFFSNIAYHLEHQQWGKRFPHIMQNLYQGRLACEDIQEAMIELKQIQKELSQISVDQVIWDIEDVTKTPPWTTISSDITDLSIYFVTSDGEDFITLMFHAMEKAFTLKEDITIGTL